MMRISPHVRQSSPALRLSETAANISLDDYTPSTWKQDRERAIPRERSPDSKARILIRNRRKRYIDMHPEYFESSHLELAGLPRSTFRCRGMG